MNNFMEEANNPSKISQSNQEDQPRTLYIGNLNCSMTEDALKDLFGQFGTITKSELTSNALSEPYAFIEFADHSSAKLALTAINKKKMFLDDGMIVIWAKPPAVEPHKEVDNKDQFKIFIGNLSSEVDDHALSFVFARFGDVLESRVILDQYTTQSRGFGFITYSKLEDAERAMKDMNGQLLDNRTIRVNWARPGSTEKEKKENLLSYEDIFYQGGPSNTSVYIGNVSQNATKEDIRSIFARFGNIVEIRQYHSHGNSFIKFDSKESAAKAIYEMNGENFMEQAIRCSWGKAEIDNNLQEQSKEVYKPVISPSDVHLNPVNNVIEPERLPQEGFHEFNELYQKGTLEMDNGQFDEALIHYSEAMKSLDAFYKSTMAQLLSKCAKAHVNRKDYKLAIIDVEKSLKFDPTLKEAYRQRLLANFELGNHEEALEDLKKIAQL